MTKGFAVFGQGVVIVITLGLIVAIIQASVEGLTIIPGMDSIFTEYNKSTQELVKGGIETIGSVIEKMGRRKGEMIDMKPGEGDFTRVEFLIPARRTYRI